MLEVGATQMTLGRAALLGDIAEALAKWEPAQLELRRSLLARVTMGTRSQVDCGWDPADPANRFGLHGPAW